MADQWIDAATALDLIQNPLTICERCHAGLIRSRAKVMRRDDEEVRDVQIPRAFWWAEGHAALDQNWTTGDFGAVVDSTRVRAFSVSFALDDLLELIPFDQHAATRRRMSVAGNPNWVSAREARRFAYNDASLSPTAAGNAILEQCRLGFITGRAVEMRFATHKSAADWKIENREWDIPLWFWSGFTSQERSKQDWENGQFSGEGHGHGHSGWITLNGVYFLRSSLAVLLPAGSATGEGGQPEDERKPALPDASLRRWWEKLEPVRERLSQTQLWVLAKAEHPDHSVARDRVRMLSEGRTPGPKRN